MPEVRHGHIGGSFAPPLSDETIAKYEAMIAALPASPVKDGMATCLNCCKKWWDLPESNSKKVPHMTGVAMTPLDKPIMVALDEHIPWENEIQAIADAFETISNETNKPLRDAAFHLLWHVRELNLDREPITKDRV